MSDNPIKTLWDNDRAMREIESLRQQLAATETRLEGVKQQRDVERVSYLNEFEKNKSLEQQLADSQKREVMLRSYLKRWAFTQSNDECAHMEVQEALAATADLDGLILCHAEPVAWQFVDDEELGYTAYNQNPPTQEQVEYLKKWNRPEWEPLCRAWEPK